MKIENVKAREILDSRGNPTVEVDVILENGIMGRASVPSGASTGSREVLELRDNDYNRYNGKGVLKAIENVNNIISRLIIGKPTDNQRLIDDIMIEYDSTSDKSRLGANAILGVSMAYLKACSINSGKELFEYIGDGKTIPYTMFNILNGGVHGSNSLSIQEFMIIPVNDSFRERLRMASEVFHSLKDILKNMGLSIGVGDEGGFSPDIKTNIDAFNLIINAIKDAGYIPGKDIMLSIDVAANEFYKNGYYYVDGNKLNTNDFIDYLIDLVDKYSICSIEDPLYEDDFLGFKLLTEKLGNKVQLVGDDFFVTNIKYLKKGIELGCGNAILIKPNQIGTISEMLDVIKCAKDNGYKTIISHRSGETEDTIIADLAVGLSLDQMKSGSLSRGERICKYNRLLRIEEKIQS